MPPEAPKTLTSFLDASVPDVGLGPCLTDDEILAFVQGDVPEIKHDRVHAHVDECEVCQRLVAEAAHAVDAEPLNESERPSWNTVFQRNAMVGKRYRVLRLVARGGMGEVYEVYDTALQERVALKTVTSTACDSAQAMRLLKAEVQHARRISHPNVCRIYDLGVHVIEPSGAEIQFLVMEFVEGEVLGKKLRESGALPIELAQSIARQLLLGLRAAHQAGILHRDLKSDNVILRTEANGRITPVILDFGLAKALNESGHMATTQSQGHAMVGTIGYMAPEQIEGEPLSRASDLYAFGVVWYEMLTGRLPFEGSTIAASALARLHRDAEPPSSVNPSIPKGLDAIVLRCLSRRRDARYGTAEQVLEELASTVDAPQSQSPVTVRMPNRLRFVLAVALGAALGLGGLIWVNATPNASKLASPAKAPRRESPAIPSQPANTSEAKAAKTTDSGLSVATTGVDVSKAELRADVSVNAPKQNPPPKAPGGKVQRPRPISAKTDATKPTDAAESATPKDTPATKPKGPDWLDLKEEKKPKLKTASSTN
jgi:serine/threonine protein kinase